MKQAIALAFNCKTEGNIKSDRILLSDSAGEIALLIDGKKEDVITGTDLDQIYKEVGAGNFLDLQHALVIKASDKKVVIAVSILKSPAPGLKEVKAVPTEIQTNMIQEAVLTPLSPPSDMRPPPGTFLESSRTVDMGTYDMIYELNMKVVHK